MGPGEFFFAEDICPRCGHGELYETDMGLDCDSCNFAIVDPKKFKRQEED